MWFNANIWLVELSFKFFTLPLLLLLNCSSSAREKTDEFHIGEPTFSGFGIHADQDAFYLPLNEDRDYTFGQGIAIGGKWIAHKSNPLRYPLYWIDHFPAKNFHLDNKSPSFHNFTLALQAYTPDDLDADSIIHNDRPYASILFFDVAKKTISGNRRLFLRSNFRLGVLGTAAAREIQSIYHRLERARRGTFRPFDPRGWKYQISNGGELTGLAGWRIGYLPVVPANQNRFQYIPKGEFAIGYQTYAGVSLELKFGKNLPPWWLDGFSGVQEGNVFYKPLRKKISLYLFAKGSYRHIVYDVLLQGQFKTSPHALDTDQIDRSIDVLEAGIAARLRHFKTWVSLKRRSSNFSLQGRNHYWVSVGLDFIVN